MSLSLMPSKSGEHDTAIALFFSHIFFGILPLSMTAYGHASQKQHTTAATLSLHAKEEKIRYRKFLNMIEERRRERYKQFVEKKRQQHLAHTSNI